MDYKKLDAGRNWHYKEDRMFVVKSLGYTYLSEMIHKLHIGGATTAEIGEKLDYNKCAINYALKYIGVGPRKKGGRNYTKLNKRLVKKLRNGWDGVGAENHYFERFMKETGLKMSYVGLRYALKSNTWPDVEAM